MAFRGFDPQKDQKAVHRIWEETGWIGRGNKNDAENMDRFLSGARSLVAELNGEAECLVTTCDGSLLHLNEDIPLSIVAAVTTSLVGRKQGLASRLTAKAIAIDAEAGLPVSALGMFEQGYYSRLGFGTGPYEIIARFNPAQLNVECRAGVPVRLTVDDYADVHQAMVQRLRGHGGVNVHPVGHMQADMGWVKNAFGLGYRNDKGQLTHFIWGSLKGEHGPMKLSAIAYQSREQLLELLALIRNLGDQVLMTRMREPFHIQLQDVLNEPFKGQNKSKGNEHSEYILAEAFWQLRINNVEACLEKTRLPGRKTLAFNLQLEDPISDYLDSEHKWQGVSGDYTIQLGESCHATAGHQKDLPLLTATVGGFSRLWMGCASANAIACTSEIAASQTLLDALDQTLSLPKPRTGWDF